MRPLGPGEDDDGTSDDEQDSLGYFEESLSEAIEDSVLDTVHGDNDGNDD